LREVWHICQVVAAENIKRDHTDQAHLADKPLDAGTTLEMMGPTPPRYYSGQQKGIARAFQRLHESCAI